MSGPTWISPWSHEGGSETASAAFTAAFDGDPQGVFSAPGRVNLIGEHTDYNGGLCLPIALQHRSFPTRRSSDLEQVNLVSERESRPWSAALTDIAPGAVTGWGSYVAGVAWALREEGQQVSGFDAAVASAVPYGAGLSSSAALECAVAVALAEFAGGQWSGPDPATDAGRAWLADICVRAENEIAGAPTGGMDQAAALRGTAGDRKSTRLNSSHVATSYAVFCLKKKI